MRLFYLRNCILLAAESDGDRGGFAFLQRTEFGRKQNGIPVSGAVLARCRSAHKVTGMCVNLILVHPFPAVVYDDNAPFLQTRSGKHLRFNGLLVLPIIGCPAVNDGISGSLGVIVILFP